MKRLIASLIILITAVSFCCCGSKNDKKEVGEAAYCSFTDSLGEKVTLQGKPEKVAVLFSSFADIWVTAGGKVDITVGEAVERGFAREDALLVDKSAGKTIDTETLLAAKPDLVICSADIEGQSQCVPILKKAGIPCAAFRVESFQDYLQVLKICTDITGNQEAYKTYGTEVEKRIQKILKEQKQSDTQRKILFIRSGSGASSAKAKTGEEHFAAKMLEELGTYNIANNAPVLLDGLSIEEILREDPGYIFIATMGDEEAAKTYMNSVLESTPWQALTAVKRSRYVYLPKEMFQFKPNAKWDQAYAYLAELLGGLD